MKVPQSLIDTVSKQINALELKKFEISFINYETGNKMSDIYTPKTFLESEKTNGILHCGVERALYLNTHRQENVYIRAVPKTGFHNEILLDHDIVLLDDIKPDGLNYIRNKYEIACVIETSLDNDMPNMQIFLKLAEKFDCESRKCVERALIHELKENGLYADPGAADGQHLARLAGFKNLGFAGKKERNHIVKLIDAPGERLAPDATADLIAQGKALPDFKTSSFHASTIEEITSRPYERPSIISHFSELLPSVKPDANPSDVDFYLMMRLARCQYSENDICKIMIEKGPNDIRRKSNPTDYLCRSVSKALDKAHQTQPQAPHGKTGGRVVSSAPASAEALAPGSQLIAHAVTPTPRPQRRAMGVKPRNIDKDRAALDRERERDRASVQREKERDRPSM